MIDFLSLSYDMSIWDLSLLVIFFFLLGGWFIRRR